MLAASARKLTSSLTCINSSPIHTQVPGRPPVQRQGACHARSTCQENHHSVSLASALLLFTYRSLDPHLFSASQHAMLEASAQKITILSHLHLLFSYSRAGPWTPICSVTSSFPCIRSSLFTRRSLDAHLFSDKEHAMLAASAQLPDQAKELLLKLSLRRSTWFMLKVSE